MGMIPKDVRVTLIMKLADLVVTKLSQWLDKKMGKKPKSKYF